MPVLASEVIDVVRDVHPSFTREDFPEKMLRRALERYQQALVSKVLQRRPQALVSATQTTALPLATFSAGVALPALRLAIREVIAQLASDATFSGQVPVTLIAPTTVFSPPSFPWASIDGNTLVLGGVAQDWIGYASVAVKYVARPTLPLNSTALVLPDEAMETCAAAVTAFAAVRAVGLPGTIDIDASWYHDRARDAEAEFLRHLAAQARGEAVRILEVW